MAIENELYGNKGEKQLFKKRRYALHKIKRGHFYKQFKPCFQRRMNRRGRSEAQ